MNAKIKKWLLVKIVLFLGAVSLLPTGCFIIGHGHGDGHDDHGDHHDDHH
jgi:uncharacterized membrane protein